MNVHDAIRIRRSVRRYADRPIADDAMQRMKDALRLAPSACNNQPWRFVIVQDADLRRNVAHAANGQTFIAEAPVVIVGVGLPGKAYKNMGGDGNSVDVDLAIALDHLTLAAAADGLGTCWIGAFDEAAVKEIIAAPADAKVVAITPLGYPATPDLLHAASADRRLPESKVFVYERFEE